MITYPTGVYGFRILFRLHGSAVFKSLTPALLSSVIYLILWYSVPQLTFNPNSRILDHPYTVGALVAAFTFLLAFRANFSYNRYWEAMTSVYHMHSKWLDVGTQLAAFHLQSKIYERQKPPTFAARPEVRSLERERERIYEPTPEEFMEHVQALEEELQNQQPTPLSNLRDQVSNLLSRNRSGSIDLTESNNNNNSGRPRASSLHLEDAEEGSQQKKHRKTYSMPADRFTYSPFKTQAKKETLAVSIDPRNDSSSPPPSPPPPELPNMGPPPLPTPTLSPVSTASQQPATNSTTPVTRTSTSNIWFPPPPLPSAMLSPVLEADYFTSQTVSLQPPPPPPPSSIRASSSVTDSVATAGAGAKKSSGRSQSLPPTNSERSKKTVRVTVPPPAPSVAPPKSRSINAATYTTKGGSMQDGNSSHSSSKHKEPDDAAFDMQSSIVTTKMANGGLESGTPTLFLQEAAHLLSLLSAVAMSTLRNDLEAAETPLIPFTPGAPWPHVDPDSYSADIRKGWTNSTHRSWTILQYLLGLTRTDASRTLYNAARPFRVIGGVSDAEIQVLQSARGPFAKTALCTMWLQEFMTREYLAGSMGSVAPPILSRLYQNTSDGMLGYNQARKVVFIPFPFPHAQITSLFVLVIVGFTPVLMLSFVNKITLGFLLNLLTVMCFTGLHEVARELESPFQNVPNDIPANNIHSQYNEALMTMFSGYHPDAFWHVAQVPTPKITTKKGGGPQATSQPGRKMFKEN